MSFPVDIQGAEGEQWQSNSTRQHNLGTRLVLQDGRMFRYVEVGASALVVGNVIQAEAPGANFDELVMAAAAVGATSVVVTTGATAVAIDDFKDGYVFIEDDAGEGYLYPLASHGAVGTTTAGTFPLRDGNSIQVALTAASTCLLLKNIYKDVIVYPVAATGAAVGVGARQHHEGVGTPGKGAPGLDAVDEVAAAGRRCRDLDPGDVRPVVGLGHHHAHEPRLCRRRHPDHRHHSRRCGTAPGFLQPDRHQPWRRLRGDPVRLPGLGLPPAERHRRLATDGLRG